MRLACLLRGAMTVIPRARTAGAARSRSEVARPDPVQHEPRILPAGRKPVHLPVLRRRMRRHHRDTGRAITGVRRSPHPANRGRLCTKGSTCTHRHAWWAPGAARAAGNRAGSPGWAVSWDRALDRCAERFRRRHRQARRADAVLLRFRTSCSPRTITSSTSWPRASSASNNIDTNSRLCMSSAVAGYKQTLGADAPAGLLRRHRQPTSCFIAGSNTAIPPILYRRIEDARRRGAALHHRRRPRRTDTSREASLHLQILPAATSPLFNAMLHVLLREGMVDTDVSSRVTPVASPRSGGGPRPTPGRPRDCANRRRGHRHRGARWFGDSPERTFSSVPGTQPVVPRHAQQRRPHQPASGDRQDGRAGCGHCR